MRALLFTDVECCVIIVSYLNIVCGGSCTETILRAFMLLLLLLLLFWIFINMIIWNSNIFAFSTVVVLHLTLHNSGVNRNLLSKISCPFCFPWDFLCRKGQNNFQSSVIFDYFHRPNLNLTYRNG